MKKILLAIVALSIVGFSSCTKEEDEAAIDVSKNTYLTKSYWKVTSVMINNDYGNVASSATEEFPNLPLCFRDDNYAFTTDGQFIIDEIFVKCNANNPQQFQYFYSISNNDKSIKIWKDPNDPGASMWLDGEITTINIDKFLTTKYETINDKIKQTVTTYEVVKRKDK